MLNRYSIVFLIIGLILSGSAILAAPSDPWMLGLLYPGMALLLLSLAYAGIGPALLGKRRNGRRAWWAVIWSLPYSLLTECLWWLAVLGHRQPALCRVYHNLYCGRRLTRQHRAAFAQHHIQGCLDLTAEFTETSFLRSLPNYRSAPILDGTAPTIEELRELVDWLTTMTTSGPVYVHCALGHGRTATVVIAFLIHHGIDTDIDSALSRLRQERPCVDVNIAQRRLLDAYLKQDIRSTASQSRLEQ